MAQNLCGYTQEEITKMLCAIQEICTNNECEECPLGGLDDCQVCGHTPQNWNVSLPKVWRALV